MKDKIIEHLMCYLPRHLATLLADEILALFAEPPPIEPIEWKGLTISFMPAWGGYVPKVDYAGIDPVKWGEIQKIIDDGERTSWAGWTFLGGELDRVDKYFEDNEDTEIIK